MFVIGTKNLYSVKAYTQFSISFLLFFHFHGYKFTVNRLYIRSLSKFHLTRWFRAFEYIHRMVNVCKDCHFLSKSLCRPPNFFLFSFILNESPKFTLFNSTRLKVTSLSSLFMWINWIWLEVASKRFDNIPFAHCARTNRMSCLKCENFNIWKNVLLFYISF